jgi:hypothetical protein
MKFTVVTSLKKKTRQYPLAALRRASTRQWVLKPQDLAVALKLVVLQGQRLPYKVLAQQMKLSQFEAHAAVQRLLAARLITDMDGELNPVKAALQNFVLHGAPYAYPPVRGEPTIGFATAHGVAPLKGTGISAAHAPVWPHPEGNVSGPGLLPLYEQAPLAARQDPALYEILALFDALRNGQARERETARRLLKERLS